MKIKILVALLVLVPLVISSVAYAGEPTPPTDETPAPEDSVIIDPQDGVIIERPDLGPDATNRYLVMLGINWFPEKVNKFSKIKRDNRGTTTRVNTPGSYYVDISIPLIDYENGKEQKIEQVGFCGQSSKGAKTKPVQWKLWSSSGIFFTGTMTWPSDEDPHCVVKTFSTPKYESGLTVSALVNYYNTSHTFTFMESWVRTDE